MTIFLAFDYHIRRDALVTHGLGVWLMVATGTVYFIPHSGRREAIIALHLCRVNSLALQFALLQPVVEGNVSGIRDELFVQTVNAFGIWTMLTKQLSLSFLILGVCWGAVKAFTARTVIALTPLGFAFLLFGLLAAHADAVETLAAGRMIAFS